MSLELALAGIETAGAIAGAISSMSSGAGAPPTGLDAKSSGLTIAVFNQTQYELVFKRLYFDSGRTFTAPTNVRPFNAMTFSVCESDRSLMTGVSGGIEFAIAMPVDIEKFAAGFSNPYWGSYKASVIANGTAEAAYEKIVDETTNDSIGPLQGADTNGKPVTLTFELVSQPGAEASITVTQVVTGD